MESTKSVNWFLIASTAVAVGMMIAMALSLGGQIL